MLNSQIFHEAADAAYLAARTYERQADDATDPTAIRCWQTKAKAANNAWQYYCAAAHRAAEQENRCPMCGI